MTEYDIVLSKQASKDMTDIYEYIISAFGSQQTAMDQFDRIADAISSLNIFPERIKLMNNSYCKARALRQLLVDNYTIIFTIRKQQIFIVRVLYSSSNIELRLQD